MTAASRSAGRGGDGQGIARLVRLFRRLPSVLAFEAADLMAARPAELRLLERVPRAFTVRPATPEDAGLVERFLGDPARAARRLASGDTSLVAVGEGAVHAAEWIRWGPAEYADDARRLGVVFRIPPASCWLHDGRNSAGVGPWGVVMGRLRVLLEARGVETAFLQVDASDAYSLACHVSLGFRRMGRLAALRIGRRHLVAFQHDGRAWKGRRTGVFDLEGLAV